MALGELLYEERGKQTSARTIMETKEPLTEVTGTGNMKYQDVNINININTHWTISVKLGQN